MGNYLMAFGALVIFSIFSLLTNKSLINNKKVAYESQFIITATSLGQSVIEEAKNKAYDQNTVSASVASKSALSTTLGREGTESAQVLLPDKLDSNTFNSAQYYNDVDDYNGYRRVVDSHFNGNDTINVQVSYADSLPPYNTIVGKSWNKKMTVTVTSSNISIPIVLTYIFSYYK